MTSSTYRSRSGSGHSTTPWTTRAATRASARPWRGRAGGGGGASPRPPASREGLRALYDAMDNASRNQGKRATVARLVERASVRKPRLLVVEDVHWADRLTLAHLAQLAATVAGCPALLVMTTRSEGDPLDQAWR